MASGLAAQLKSAWIACAVFSHNQPHFHHEGREEHGKMKRSRNALEFRCIITRKGRKLKAIESTKKTSIPRLIVAHVLLTMAVVDRLDDHPAATLRNRKRKRG
jgi:hypothetical protein